MGPPGSAHMGPQARSIDRFDRSDRSEFEGRDYVEITLVAESEVGDLLSTMACSSNFGV